MLRYKQQTISNFSGATQQQAKIFRPEWEEDLVHIFKENPQENFLPTGQRLSYSDSCLSSESFLIDTTRLNRLLGFDPTTGVVVCEGGVTFADLFQLNPNFIPPVLPGTCHATLAGGIAHDVHGKNNPHFGTLGHHVQWIDLLVNEETIRCSATAHPELFRATIGGLGLTGVIKRLALKLHQQPHGVKQSLFKFSAINDLLPFMENEGLKANYQAAWLDLLSNKPRALLAVAVHHESTMSYQHSQVKHQIPKLPFRLISPMLMKQFNRLYFYANSSDPKQVALWQYNNPLDSLNGWNYLYGPQGLLQFQAVFAEKEAAFVIAELLKIMKFHKVAPLLSVLKLFQQPGFGLLSFPMPGFTLAMDFIHQPKARAAIIAMNDLLCACGGKVYLAKDQLLTPQQFRLMYGEHSHFTTLLQKYPAKIKSALSQRLEIAT